jgi:tRNA threonylcarbamoyladenosine biosynthesis protein TsaB
MILVIDTATAACSVALLDGTKVVAADHARVGRGHAERLIPMIASLPDGGRAGSILVNCGPGSFTGIRVGLAAARALGLGWDVPVMGYSTHTLIAAMAFSADTGLARAAVIMEGGHGEVYVQTFAAYPFGATNDLQSLLPVDAQVVALGHAIVGNATIDGIVRLEPAAEAAVHLAVAHRNLAPTPIYGRGPDAKLPGVRRTAI